MLKTWVHKKLDQMQDHYGYNVDYMRRILDTSLSAFIKYSLFQIMSNHSSGVPAAVYAAARIRASLVDDCGPCIQLVVDMALEAGVPQEVVFAIVAGRTEALDEDIALVVRFTDFVMSHSPQADNLREQIKAKWGDNGLITISYCIATARVYPALKYSMGYGKTCSRVTVGNESVNPTTNATQLEDRNLSAATSEATI